MRGDNPKWFCFSRRFVAPAAATACHDNLDDTVFSHLSAYCRQFELQCINIRKGDSEALTTALKPAEMRLKKFELALAKRQGFEHAVTVLQATVSDRDSVIRLSVYQNHWSLLRTINPAS
jgi:hypothetical protein